MPKIPVPSKDTSIATNTTTKEPVRILRRPDLKKVSKQLDKLKEKGINSLAIAFVHSYLWGEHENQVAKLAKDKGFQVSVSHQLQPMVKFNLPLPPFHIRSELILTHI